MWVGIIIMVRKLILIVCVLLFYMRLALWVSPLGVGGGGGGGMFV